MSEQPSKPSTVDGPAPSAVARMAVSGAFATLNDREKLYAHHLSRAAWLGALIILDQVSPESRPIFHFILEIHRACEGNWDIFLDKYGVPKSQIDNFQEYAATFLSNIGNYFGRGDQKFTPRITRDSFDKLASVSDVANMLGNSLRESLWATPPYGLGYPSSSTQSQYYLGNHQTLDVQQIQAVSRLLERKNIWPENTRLRLSTGRIPGPVIEVLQASTKEDDVSEVISSRLEIDSGPTCTVTLRRGDFAHELREVCKQLFKALPYTSNETQRIAIQKYIESFETGDLEAYRESQRSWLKDITPRIENVFGFVEPYRDPAGMRAEFEALVGIEDPEESRILKRLVDNSDKYIRRLPWTKGHSENDGKGPFEKKLFDAPSFASVHTLAYCSTILFDGINLPNYNDIRQKYGFKNLLIANRLAAGSKHEVLSTFVDDAQKDSLKRHSSRIGYLSLVVHELLGHGTGQMMAQEDDNTFSFDPDNPPTNPITGKPISTWYKPGQTWTGQFGDIATSVDECRCELVGASLICDTDLLSLFGHNGSSELKPQDLVYLFYVRLCALALLDLMNYNPKTKTWGQAHGRAHFAMLKCLLQNGKGSIKIDHRPKETYIAVNVDRGLVMRHGKVALDDMLLRLHMYRVTADVEGCRPYFEDLSAVDAEHLAWRDTVSKQNISRLLYVHANTFLDGETVVLKEYDETNLGIIQSWADRMSQRSPSA